MTDTTKKATAMTPKFRVSFPHVFEPQEAMNGGKAKYGLSMLFEPGADLSELKALAAAALNEKWPNKDKRPKNLRNPFRDQGEKEFEGCVAGAVFINATSMQRPGLVDNNVQPIIDQADFYPGCYARATVTAFAYDTAGNAGVAFGLNNIQKLADGEPLGGRTNPEADFAPVASAATPSSDDIFG